MERLDNSRCELCNLENVEDVSSETLVSQNLKDLGSPACPGRPWGRGRGVIYGGSWRLERRPRVICKGSGTSERGRS
eukprot:1709859-Pyramimonas_sp.AAC.1